MTKIIASVIAAGTLIGMCFGVFFYFEGRYARAETVQRVEQRLDLKIKADRLNAIQERIWRVEDRVEGRKPTDLEKEELRTLQEQKKAIEIDLKRNEK